MKRELLQKLYDHGKSGNFKADIFDFGSFRHTLGYALGACKTAGCMAGELPYVFPNDWVFEESSGLNTSYKLPRLLPSAGGRVIADLMTFFDIPEIAAEHIFYPGEQHEELFGGCKLYEKASLADVLDNMAIFLERTKDMDINILTESPEDRDD